MSHDVMAGNQQVHTGNHMHHDVMAILPQTVMHDIEIYINIRAKTECSTHLIRAHC